MPERAPSEQLAELIGAGDSKIVAAIFETLTDEDEARVLLAAAPPATVQELAERTGLEESEIEKMIDPLFKKGLLFKSRKAEGTRYYRVRSLGQFHDSSAVMIDPPQKMLDLWKQWMEEEWLEVTRQRPRPGMRVIPVNVSVDFNSQILAFEDVRELIGRARIIAVTRCSCRAIDGACGEPLEVCMQLDKAADYAIERGTGRSLTDDEALDMLRMCEEEGLVHTAGNAKTGHVVCNCCRDCCINWTSPSQALERFAAPSRFRASIQEEECTGCELCVERCFFDAMHMDEDGLMASVTEENCLGCGLCQVVCAPEAIVMREVRPQEFIPA
jgi:Pyruvate/2-oxoacid:ferredoxin oxidoreductase delta subunit/DNA-binding MarR family transcriptional regulator